MRVKGLKAANHNGYRQIIRPTRERGTGLKILVSAVQSRPSPPFFSRAPPGPFALAAHGWVGRYSK